VVETLAYPVVRYEGVVVPGEGGEAVSRSDKDWKPGMHGLERHWATFALPRGTGRYLRSQWNKRQRQAERAALRREHEPEPTRTRHSVHYDYW
jgi:hypothetical protein